MSASEHGTALVTGAASGIGLATARRLAEDGWPVVLVDRNEAGVADAVAELQGAGHRAIGVAADVSDYGSVEKAVAQGVAAFGELNAVAVAACAGIAVLGSVLDLTPEDWQRTLSVNLTGVFNVAKATMPSLVATRGAFVAVSSDAGHTGAQGYSAYTASKHGVVGLVRCLALDFGPAGVRVNTVAPAFVETPMAESIFADAPAGEKEFYEASVPLGRFARPEEVASAIAHLLGDGASYTNGLVYAIDGGATAGYYRPA